LFYILAKKLKLDMKNRLTRSPLILLLFIFQMAEAQPMKNAPFDWQGHRGTRGLAPENTIPAFLKALEFPVTTLELDVVVSKDGQLIVSHDPWMQEQICSHPDGTPVDSTDAKKLKIIGLTYAEIKTYDCGRRGNILFPQQVAQPAHKPSLEDMLAAIKAYCFEHELPLPHFNIEIKSQPDWDGVFTPAPEKMAELLLRVAGRPGLKDKVCIQSFDVRALEAVHRLAPDMTTALLVENTDSWKDNLGKLSFQPDIYSPDFKLLRKRYIKKLHKRGIRVIPWTVNTVEEMKRLRRKGVDGIITDYPHLIAKVEAKK
jgi:glycerophosphoryl diester phosphodiesterase